MWNKQDKELIGALKAIGFSSTLKPIILLKYGALGGCDPQKPYG